MVPDNISLHCPYCGKATNVSPAPLSVIVQAPNMPNGIMETTAKQLLGQAPWYVYGSGRWWMGMCNACHKPVLVKDRGAEIHPVPQPGPVNEAIPEPMHADLAEAKRCLAASAWNATVVMARRSLQCAAVERGAPAGQQLWKQIAWLETNRNITLEQKEWADAARWVGNHGAHDTEPDVANGVVAISDVTEEDAKATIQLVEHLFETLYVATKIAQEQLAKRGKLPKT